MRVPSAIPTEALLLAFLALGLASPQAIAAEELPHRVAASAPKSPAASGVDFEGRTASRDVREVAQWVVSSRDNQGLPFVIIDKVNAKVFVFARDGQVQGSAPTLLGLGRGDHSVAGIGKRRLATIGPEERTTPAGRFQAALGRDFEQDILWIDYEAALSLHRVIVGKPKERRHQRLATASPLDNRISYGCLNVPAKFYDAVVVPAFTGTVGIVYILPETKPIRAVFAIPANEPN